LPDGQVKDTNQAFGKRGITDGSTFPKSAPASAAVDVEFKLIESTTEAGEKYLANLPKEDKAQVTVKSVVVEKVDENGDVKKTTVIEDGKRVGGEEGDYDYEVGRWEKDTVSKLDSASVKTEKHKEKKKKVKKEGKKAKKGSEEDGEEKVEVEKHERESTNTGSDGDDESSSKKTVKKITKKKQSDEVDSGEEEEEAPKKKVTMKEEKTEKQDGEVEKKEKKKTTKVTDDDESKKPGRKGSNGGDSEMIKDYDEPALPEGEEPVGKKEKIKEKLKNVFHIKK